MFKDARIQCENISATGTTRLKALTAVLNNKRKFNAIRTEIYKDLTFKAQ